LQPGDAIIERIEIPGCASYGDQVEQMNPLRSVNYVYGSNGAGKTTVSRLVADASLYSRYAVHWERGTSLETLVYIRDFVSTNFDQSSELKGIFTLGQKNIETQRKIEEAKKEIRFAKSSKTLLHFREMTALVVSAENSPQLNPRSGSNAGQ